MVKVLCVSDAPDYEQPWQSRGPTTSVGSGAIIQTHRGMRVLTNAHCVANQVFVEVRRYGNAQKYVAEVEVIGHECDLALLSVEDDAFFHNTTPLTLGPLPALSDRVSVCGYPVGGERLSITEGIVSRIELVSYAQSNRSLLAVQIDAAINAGNSGGPVMRKGELVGVAFQALDDAEQIGYMIAPSVVRHFLRDIEEGDYRGFPSLSVRTQTLEAPAHRRYLGFPPKQSGGVLLTQIIHGGSGDGVLEPGDVLLEIDSAPVASDGTVVLREGELINFKAVVTRRHVGERVPVVVWRDGQRLDCLIELRPPQSLVAEERFDVRPSYYLFGGLLIVPLTCDYLKTWGEDWWQTAPKELVSLYENGVPTAEREHPVVLQKVLADRVNQGYHDVESMLVSSVDGHSVRSITNLIELVEAGQGTYVTFKADSGRIVVLNRERAITRNPTILRKYGVRYERSDDLRPAPVSSK